MADTPMFPELLVEAVERNIKMVRTASLDVSFNELLDMHSDEELIIQPEYQRLFRWSQGKQSQFIESLILELPVPPIFVIEQEEGVYELIDGLQRVSSYLHFRGKHPDRRDDDTNEMKQLVLADCDIVRDLNGLTYDRLPHALQIKLKRNFVRMQVIRKESDPRLRYHMFKRLNTGGEVLSDQEVRNCTIRLLSNDFNTFIMRMSDYPPFRRCIESLSESKIEQKGDQELVLRFFSFKNYRESYVHEVSDFMTEFMELVSDPETAYGFDYEAEELLFKRTFDVLAASLGDQAFSRANENGRIVSGFSQYHYEAFAIGLQGILDDLNPDNQQQMKQLKSVAVEIKCDPDFRELTTGGGKNYKNPLDKRIRFVAERLRDRQWVS